jgi:hypothetical protein
MVRKIISRLLPKSLKTYLVQGEDTRVYIEWAARGFDAPSPSCIKQAVLIRNGIKGGAWIETGTYMGDTTEALASSDVLAASAVYTIEPEPILYEKAVGRFEGRTNIRVINGLSEDVFPNLLPTLTGKINFWLDGHWSGGATHKGAIDCPVRAELLHIENNMGRYEEVVVCVDDIRLFDPELPGFADYPKVEYLIEWANRLNMKWHIEHDIFIAQK